MECGLGAKHTRRGCGAAGCRCRGVVGGGGGEGGGMARSIFTLYRRLVEGWDCTRMAAAAVVGAVVQVCLEGARTGATDNKAAGTLQLHERPVLGRAKVFASSAPTSNPLD